MHRPVTFCINKNESLCWHIHFWHCVFTKRWLLYSSLHPWRLELRHLNVKKKSCLHLALWLGVPCLAGLVIGIKWGQCSEIYNVSWLINDVKSKFIGSARLSFGTQRSTSEEWRIACSYGPPVHQSKKRAE